MRSGVTSRTVNRPELEVVSAMVLCGLLHLLGGCENVLDATLQVEGLLRDAVVLAFDDLLEGANRVFYLDVSARNTGEDLGDVEGLRKEPLHLAGASHGDLVLFREF